MLRRVVCSVSGLEPRFNVLTKNVTVISGQTAVLPCSVDFLGIYKVTYNPAPPLSRPRRPISYSTASFSWLALPSRLLLLLLLLVVVVVVVVLLARHPLSSPPPRRRSLGSPSSLVSSSSSSFSWLAILSRLLLLLLLVLLARYPLSSPPSLLLLLVVLVVVLLTRPPLASSSSSSYSTSSFSWLDLPSRLLLLLPLLLFHFPLVLARFNVTYDVACAL